ncbi:NRDE family protein [Aestuariibaculum sp. M13]|uniref:NRDE family protein n=1 Tax=Aestuariibaculum sp. M13 TaxID=2967132 RepID=UPI002159FEAB|nr:NRDE family protein [Aestuariibaculum sp. M13]MCR8668338.1 NRDE family protein [Aestuariibaculum sp. M13]
MCTVTLVPKWNNNFILTSNRDEAPSRVSIPPEIYSQENSKLLFPKDEISGGTWIGVSEHNRVVCVLNGAFDLHERRDVYRRSRGLVATDFLLFEEDIEHEIHTYNFEDIEPFTIVVADWNNGLKFFELVWDGELKYFKELPLEEHIWSSSTLYTGEMKSERKSWFETFKEDYKLTTETIMKFHKHAGQGNLDYGVIMDRGFVKTTSITQIEKSNHKVSMCYENLHNDIITNKTLKYPEIVSE